MFVAAKSNCVLIADTDGDDRAEEPIVVATAGPSCFIRSMRLASPSIRATIPSTSAWARRISPTRT